MHKNNEPCLIVSFLIGFSIKTKSRVNVSSIHKDKESTESSEIKASFTNSYGALTVQQKVAQSAATEAQETLNYDDYYLDDSYAANERFYTELRTSKVPGDVTKYEYELLACQYTSLNVSDANASMADDVARFKQLTEANGRLTSQQLTSLFLLNKHNGVLSSRRTINEMLPGMQFRCKLTNTS